MLRTEGRREIETSGMTEQCAMESEELVSTREYLSSWCLGHFKVFAVL